jgi:hypothetical protein
MVLLVLVASGCGKTNPGSGANLGASAPSSPSAPATTTPAPAQPGTTSQPGATPQPGTAPQPATPPESGAPPQKGVPSPQKMSAFAGAVNLRLTDLPGFVVTPASAPSHKASERRLQEQLDTCAGALHGALGGGGEHSSPQFHRRGDPLQDGVSSDVSFLEASTSVASTLALLRSSHTRGCLAAYLKGLLAGQRFGGATVSSVSLQQGSPPATGSAGGFGWRVTAVFALRGLRVPFYLDILGFVYRRAVVTLLSSAVVVPFPAGAEEHLFELLLTRARAQSL